MIAGADGEELLARRSRLLAEARARSAAACCVFRPLGVFYLTGFAFIPTERPVALLLGDNSTTLFVPRLEEEHAGRFALVDQVIAYPEYP